MWQLLTLKDPTNVQPDDYKTYEKIMLQTKAYLNDNGHVKSNRGKKYESLVRPIYEKSDEYRDRNITRRTSLGPEEDLTLLTQRMRSISLSEGTSAKGARDPEGPTGSGVGPEVPAGQRSVVFLPSDPNELVERHELLLGSYKAGNTGIFNELNAINDKLLDLGIFNIDDVRRLQNFLAI